MTPADQDAAPGGEADPKARLRGDLRGRIRHPYITWQGMRPGAAQPPATPPEPDSARGGQAPLDKAGAEAGEDPGSGAPPPC